MLTRAGPLWYSEGTMNVGEIVSRVARRHCGATHVGASPCDECAQIRAIALEAIGEFLSTLVVEVHRNLE